MTANVLLIDAKIQTLLITLLCKITSEKIDAFANLKALCEIGGNSKDVMLIFEIIYIQKSEGIDRGKLVDACHVGNCLKSYNVTYN